MKLISCSMNMRDVVGNPLRRISFWRAARDPLLTRAAEFASIGKIYKFLAQFLCIITYCNFPIMCYNSIIKRGAKEREVNKMDNYVVGTCVFCGNEHRVEVDTIDWLGYTYGGDLAQVAFPSPKYSIEDREFIISRICPKCQVSVFGGGNE